MASDPAKRLYHALSAMMYGWEDDGTRLEAFAALKEAEAEPFIESTPTWDDAAAALTRHARLDSTGDEVKAAFHIAVNWLAVNKPTGGRAEMSAALDGGDPPLHLPEVNNLACRPSKNLRRLTAS